MNETERDRVFKSIVNYRIAKSEIDEGEVVSNSEIYEVEDELRELSDEELRERWFSTVGDWVDSMSRWSNDEYHENEKGMSEWEERGFESVVDWQFYKLTTEGTTSYRPAGCRYKQPYE